MNFVTVDTVHRALRTKVRRTFNPADSTDVAQLAYFRKHNKWEDGCPFIVEWPFDNAAAMCLNKYTDHMLLTK